LKILLTCTALALAAGIASAAPDSAASAVPGSAASAASGAVSSGDAASFRADFSSILDRYETVFQRRANARGLKAVGEARQALKGVSDDQFARVFGKMGRPDLGLALEAAQRLETATPDRPSGGPAPLTPGFPNAPDILGDCDNIVHDSSFTFGALVAFQVLRTVLAAAEFACLETVVILGEGGNGSAVCIPFAIAQDVAAIPWELADFCGGEEDSALAQGSYDRLEHIHSDLEAARADVISNSNDNRVLIVNNDNANRTLIIDNDNTNRTLIINNDNANRDLIMGDIRGLACDLMRLINTPEGQRSSANAACVGQPQYPYNFPEHP